MTHTGDKPYQCNQYDKAFRWKGDLTRHKVSHTGNKPYQCNQCDKAFIQKGGLTKHKVMHTGGIAKVWVLTGIKLPDLNL